VNWGPTWTPIERQTPRRITVEAQRQISVDLTRAARDKDFLESDAFVKNAPSLSKRIDLPEAFGFYCDKAGIKGGATGPTAKRWRPKIAAFCEFVGHSDLCRMTSDDAYRWVDHLTEQGIAKKVDPRSLDRLVEGRRRLSDRARQADDRKSLLPHSRQGRQADQGFSPTHRQRRQLAAFRRLPELLAPRLGQHQL
jgi:hypothetical protein